MPIPIAIPIVIAAAHFLKGLFGHKQETAQAAAQREAQQRAYDAQKGNYDASEKLRGSRVVAGGHALDRVQGSLGNGAPDYRMAPADVTALSAPRPYGGSMPTDPRRGLTWKYLSGLAGGVASGAQDAMLGGMLNKNSSGMTSSNAGSFGIEGNGEDTTTTSASTGGYDPGTSRYLCALYPSLPSCRSAPGAGLVAR